jgi:hypothetical protein
MSAIQNITNEMQRTGFRGIVEQAKQDEQSAASDPSYRALVDIKTALKETLKVQVQGTVTTKDSEGEGKEKPGSQ